MALTCVQLRITCVENISCLIFVFFDNSKNVLTTKISQIMVCYKQNTIDVQEQAFIAC